MVKDETGCEPRTIRDTFHRDQEPLQAPEKYEQTFLQPRSEKDFPNNDSE